MTGTTSVRRKENRQEKMMKDEGGNADGDECWSPWGVFTLRSFYTEKSLHRGVFTHRNFYTYFLHGSFYTQVRLHTIFFTHILLYTQIFSHKEVFTHKSSCTEKSLHKGAFTHRSFYTFIPHAARVRAEHCPAKTACAHIEREKNLSPRLCEGHHRD